MPEIAQPVTASPLPVLLLTRPRPQAERFAAEARAACPAHEPLIAPLSEIVPLPFDAGALAGARALVLTSANAVPALARVPAIAGLPAFCVGPGTARAARAAGFRAREAGGDAERMVARLRRLRPAGPLVHVHGRHLARDIAAELASDGIQITGVAVYEARALDWPPGTLERLGNRAVVAPLFSPRAAAGLARQLGGVVPAGLQLVAISEACAARLPPALRQRAVIARAPDAAAMHDAVKAALSQADAGGEP